MATDSLGELTVDLIANTGGFEKGMDKAQRALRSATKEASYQANQLDKLVGQIDPVTAAYGRLDKMEDQLRKHRAAGRLDQDDFSDYLGKLNQQRTALSAANDSMVKGSMSAKAYSAALRGVPAQFTDIITSLQGGQSPFTVLLQQGGQLKDQFGGAGAATKALASYMGRLVTPTTAAGVALAAVGYAAYDAWKQEDDFRTALFNGNLTLGLTSDMMMTLAKNSGAATGSLGRVEEAFKALATSGKVSVGQFQNLAEAASSVSQYTGKSASDVAKAFAELGDNATIAAQKASQQYGLVNASQYEVIKSLDDQGEHQKALDTLSETLNKNALERNKQFRASLSDIERDWVDLKAAASEFYSSVRAQVMPSLDQQIGIIENILATREKGGALGKISDAFGFGSNSTESLKTQLTALQQRRDLAQQNAAAQAELNKANQDYISLSAKIGSDLANTSPEEKKKKAIKDLNDEYFALMEASAKAGKNSPLLAGVDYDGKSFSGGSYAERMKKIDDDYAKSTKQPAYREDAGTKLLDTLKQQNAELQAQSALADTQVGKSQTLGEKAKALAAWEQQLADIKTKKTLTADQKSLLASEDQLTAEYQANAALEKRVELRKQESEEARKLLAFQDNLDSQLSSAKDGLDASLAGIGLGNVQQQRIQEQVRIQQSYQTQLDRLEAQHNKGGISDSLYSDETIALRQALSDRLKMQQDYYANVDAAQANWKLGATSAYQDYLQSAADVAGQTKTLFSDAFTGMEDSIVQFAKTGKLSFSDFADAVLEDMARIAARQATSSLLSMGVSALTSYFTGSSSTSLGASQAGYSSTYFPQSGRAVGGLVSPNSLYQVNERGPELYSQDGKTYLMTGGNGGSVTPLSSGTSSSDSVGASSGSAVNVHINIASDGSSQVSADSSGLQSFGDEIGKFIEQKYRQFEAKSLSPQGNIRKAINGR
ncbi:phage tail tape measure protein [Pseudomonas typographi]|uniref:phage tail tape measure protein n=1 Tax=Pseudomonas typographi TaxID=2715964 RepID=UPI001686C24F|nr:phage tail tape measure protein [Pseudomonas typographi]MBD1590172.1 phage tail tape measure protein [Pseudomonas typographi]